MSVTPIMNLRSKLEPIIQPRGLFKRILAFRPLLHKSNNHAAYIQSLQDQITQMERHLRQSEMEAVQLRTLLRSQSSSNRRSTSSTIREQDQIEQTMRQSIARLAKEIQQLTDTKAQMEELLEHEQTRTRTAEDALQVEQLKSQELVKNSRNQMEDMKEAIMTKASLQMEEMEQSHRVRLQTKVDQMQRDADKALEQEKTRSGVALTKERCQLEEEKKKGEEAVEKERIKMRKLVKALAEKEKRDLARGAKKDSIKSKTQTNAKGNRRVSGISKSGSLNTGVARKARVRGKTKNS